MRTEEYADLIRANKQLSDKARQSHDEPKTDCIFYDAGQVRTPFCRSLRELYCRVENCKFYKKKL